MHSIWTPMLSASQGLSAVKAVAPRVVDSARQARSPSDSPSVRVATLSAPAAKACALSNGTTSTGSAETIAKISSGSRIRSLVLATSSARFTALILQALVANACSTYLPSLFWPSQASSAEVSITTSVIHAPPRPDAQQLTHRLGKDHQRGNVAEKSLARDGYELAW